MENQKMQEPLVYRRILLTVDEDDNTSSERAFRYATTLAHDYDVPLGICSVLESEDINIFDSLTPSKIQAKRKHVLSHEYCPKLLSNHPRLLSDPKNRHQNKLFESALGLSQALFSPC